MSGYPMREREGASGSCPCSRCGNLESPEASLERLRTGRFGYRVFKRTFDIGLSLAVLILFPWVFLVIAFAIKLDDPTGPVIFKQVRVGRDGREFVCYKFRSMHVDAESRIEELMACNEKDAPVFKMRRDPRVTRVGRALRKASLDELPQFWNVLKGDMSVVGPRPSLPRELPGYPARALPRFGIRPGITCYWQTRRNRDSITFDEWMDLDLLYLQKAGIWTDIKLIIQTVGCVLTFQGE